MVRVITCTKGSKNIEHYMYKGDLAIVAGSDTTSNAIANALYFIMRGPAIYKRLKAEIDGLGDNLMDCAMQEQLPYLNAVLWVIFF